MTRDDKGRFLKGAHGNPKGRPKKEVEDTYLQAFRDGVSPDDWNAIISRAVSDAKRGDRYARQFVADYLIGPAKLIAEITAVVNIGTVEVEKDYGDGAGRDSGEETDVTPAPGANEGLG